ncbi:MAG: GIY-YIG nuclease family protein [Balneolaceae bacterium]|nr:GIY-YIG nuclease family protein [Balneolaceae bacterium]
MRDVGSNPKRRLFFHNNSDRKKHTHRYRPWKLVYTRGIKIREQALAAEAKVKSWKSKKMIR